MAKKKKDTEAVIVQPMETEVTPSKLELLRRKPLYRAKLDEQSLTSLQEQMQNYFLLKLEDRKPPTLVGLANYLGVHRQTMNNYAERNPGFKKLLDLARQYCEEVLVEGTLTQKLNVVGGIFILKNHFEDYIDKKEVSTTAVFVDSDKIQKFKERKQLKNAEVTDAKVVELKAVKLNNPNLTEDSKE